MGSLMHLLCLNVAGHIGSKSKQKQTQKCKLTSIRRNGTFNGTVWYLPKKFFIQADSIRPKHWSANWFKIIGFICLTLLTIKINLVYMIAHFQGWACILFKRMQRSCVILLSFQNNAMFSRSFTFFIKRMLRSLRSFTFFIKECSILCILLCSL